MKKTISINLKGINFNFEEDAYELLQDYLDRLEIALANDEGKNDILDDVELRITELCSELITETKTVIEVADIESILATLGEPSSFISEDVDDEESNYENNTTNSEKKYEDKRLYRDRENAIFGGVCAGIANYFSIDVVLVRAVFVLMFFLALSGFPIYIILWLIIPPARTTIDRLRMKGRAVTVDSLKEEVEQAAERIKDGSKRFANRIRREEFRNEVRFARGTRILANILGAGIIMMALTFLILFIVFIAAGIEFIPVHSDTGFLSLSAISELILIDSSDQFLCWTGGIMASMSFILFLFLLGSMLLFRLRNKWTRLSFLGLFSIGFVGFIMCLIVGIKTGRDFSIEGEIEREIGSIQSTQLVINSLNNTLEKSSKFKVKTDDQSLMTIKNERIEFHGVRLIFKLSSDSSFHVYQNLSSRGYTRKEAVERSKHIKHNISFNDDTVELNLNYSFPTSDKIRDQEVSVIVEMPEGGVVKLNGKDFRLGSKGREKIDDEDYYEEGYLHSDGHYHHYD